MLSNLKETKPVDINCIHEAHAALGAVMGLLMSTGVANNLHLVNPDDLCTLLRLISERLEEGFPEYDEVAA